MTRLLRRPDLAALFVLALLPFVVFWPVTLGGRTLLPADNLVAFEPWASAAPALGWPATPANGLLSDLVLENYVWKRFALDAFRAGQLPLWNPYLFAGQPFLAAGQHSALYPFSVLFYLLPLWQAYGWFTVSQLFLAGAFTYGLLRVLGAGRPAALLAGVTYQLSSFMLASVVFPMFIAGAAWLPLVLASLELLIRRAPFFGAPARAPWLVLGAIALGCQLLAGHIEITYYTLLVAAAWAAWRLAGQWLARDPAGRRRLPAGSALAALALAALGIGLGAVQFIPLLELGPHNFRQGSASYEQITGWAYPNRHVLALLMPNVFGSPAQHGVVDWWTGATVAVSRNVHGDAIDALFWGSKNYVEGAAYVGILPLVLALVGLAAGLDARSAPAKSAASEAASEAANGAANTRFTATVFFGGLAVLAYSFAFGLPTYRLIFWLPGIDQLHSPFRWVWPATLALAVLAGFGADALARWYGRAPDSSSRTHGSPVRARARAAAAARILALVAGWGGAALVAAVLLAGLRWELVAPLAETALQRLALADRAFADARQFFSFEARQLLLLSLFLIGAGVVVRLARCPIFLPRALGGLPVWQPLAVLLVALDLTVAIAGFNPAADPAILAYRPPVADFLARDATPWRFTTYSPPESPSVLEPNTGMFFDWQDVRGYDSMITRRYVELLGQVQPQGLLPYNKISPLTEPAALDAPVLDLLGVKYVLSTAEIAHRDYRLVYDEEVRVYENRTVLPRAFAVPLCNALPEPDGAAEAAAALAGLDLGRQLLVDDPGLAAAGCPAGPPAPATPATVTVYTRNEVRVDLALGAPGYLLLADSYFPGWLAYARPQGAGEEAEQELAVRRADANFRAVRLEPGAWTVRFRYSPLSVRLGLFASVMSAMLLIFVAGTWAWRRIYGASATGSTAWRVARNSFAPMAVNLLNRVIDFAFAAFMLRVLGPAGAGHYYFAGVVAGWFEIVTNFGLNTYLTREVARDRAQAGRFLLNTTILRWLLWLAAAPLVLAVIGLWRARFGLGDDVALAIGLLYLALIPGSLSTGLTAMFYAFEKVEYPAAITTITTVIKVTLGALALLLGYGFVGLAAVALVTNLATLLVLLIVLRRVVPELRLARAIGRRDAAPASLALQREVLGESFPLMLNHLLATLFFKVDVLLLEPLRGAQVVGWYSTGYKFLEAFNIIPAYFTMAFFPVMARQARESPAALQRAYQISVKFLVMLALPLAVTTVLLAHPLIALLGGSAYLPHGALALQLMVLSIPIGWINSLTQYVLIALGRQRSLTRAFLIAVSFNVVANLIFIPLSPNGYEAAAIITILSELVEAIPFYLTLRRALAPVPWLALLGRPFLAALAMAALAAVLAPVNLLLAVLAANALYAGLLLASGALGAEELALLRRVIGRGQP